MFARSALNFDSDTGLADVDAVVIVLGLLGVDVAAAVWDGLKAEVACAAARPAVIDVLESESEPEPAGAAIVPAGMSPEDPEVAEPEPAGAAIVPAEIRPEAPEVALVEHDDVLASMTKDQLVALVLRGRKRQKCISSKLASERKRCIAEIKNWRN